MKEFRLLRPEEIECRVQKVTQKGVSLLLYKTARTDADILDEKYGAFGWMNDFKVVDGTLYGGICIGDDDHGYIWKWDAGTESNTEAEKGRASDAFKRAGFKWGIGRELYSAPFIFIPASKCNITDGKCYDKFDVGDIQYDEQEKICYLCLTLKGSTVFEWGTPKNNPKAIYCADCGRHIKAGKKNDGSVWTPVEIAAYTKAFSGRELCIDCGKVEKQHQYETRR